MSPGQVQQQQPCQRRSRSQRQLTSAAPVHNNRTRTRTAPHGLPEYLYHSYERVVDVRHSSDDIPLLTDARTGREISYRLFQRMSSILASNLASRHSVTRGSIIAIISSSTIDLPVICAAAWLLCASVVALGPSAGLQLDDLMLKLGTLRQMPCTFFVPSSMFTLINQALAASAQQRRRWEQFNQPNVVVIHTDAPEPTDAVQNQDNFPSRAWTMDELYESPEGGMQLQRPNLTYEQAQEITAVIYFHHYTDGSGLRQIQLSEMSHANVIELYQTSLRDSPSTPTISRYFRFPSSRDPSLPRGSADRSYQTESGLETAYTVFRMHRAYRLHATVMDIFCRGAMYVVSQLFRPEEFMRAISRYGLHKAELTYQEIKQLVEYIEDREGPSTANWIDLLKTLRFVYTESDGAATEFGSRLHAQLPDIKIVRTRFGSYVDPVA